MLKVGSLTVSNNLIRYTPPYDVPDTAVHGTRGSSKKHTLHTCCVASRYQQTDEIMSEPPACIQQLKASVATAVV